MSHDALNLEGGNEVGILNNIEWRNRDRKMPEIFTSSRLRIFAREKQNR